MKTQGQNDYEADVKLRPRYHDGGKRKAWDRLSEVEQWSWNRPVSHLRKKLIQKLKG